MELRLMLEPDPTRTPGEQRRLTPEGGGGSLAPPTVSRVALVVAESSGCGFRPASTPFRCSRTSLLSTQWSRSTQRPWGGGGGGSDAGDQGPASRGQSTAPRWAERRSRPQWWPETPRGHARLPAGPPPWEPGRGSRHADSGPTLGLSPGHLEPLPHVISPLPGEPLVWPVHGLQWGSPWEGRALTG